ncbi:MAG: efflux RND transporter periplasmic adaptor subunit [Rhodocyclaceae bacterium]
MNTAHLLALLFAATIPGIVFAQATASGLPTVQVQFRDIDLTYPADGSVEATHQATVAAQVQGRVMEVRVDAGSRVKRGDVLMRIDEREAAQGVAGAQAQVAQAQANAANARAAYERTRNLFAQKFVSRAALDQAEAAHRTAAAQVEVAVAGRAQAGTARSFTAVTSPLTGVVAQRLTEQGEMATPGKALVWLYEPGSLRAVASVPQYKLDQVRRTLRAKVEFPESQRWVDATSVTVLPSADARTRSVQVRVDLPGEAGGVVPGMFARIHFITGRARKLLLPWRAVVHRGEITAVYVQTAPGELQFRQVRLGEPLADGQVEILAGVAAGESVVLDPVQAGIQMKRAAGKG